MKSKISHAGLVGSMAFMLFAGALVIMPTKAHAFEFGRLVDPFCLFACDDDGGSRKTVTNNYTNSNNVNSNINSPGASIGSVSSASHLAYSYPQTPVYNYGSYPSYSYNYPQYGALQASCYPMPLNAQVGQNVTWSVSAYGGTGSYHYTWTGTDGLSGYGSSVTKTYYSSGSKSATVTVTSGGQTISRNCDGAVLVQGNDYYNPPMYNPPVYNPPQYYNPPVYYQNLSVSCSANVSFTSVGSSVVWTAYATGGGGYFTYSWNGTDGLYGSGQSSYINYRTPGQKFATVTVYSGNQRVTQTCSNTVTVSGGYSAYPVVPGVPAYPVAPDNLDIACFVDPGTVRVNQPVTWSAEATGGIAPYRYSWTGSDGLSGTQATAIKYYQTAGEKNAIITITSADGRTGTRSCANTVTVRSAAVSAPSAPVVPPPPAAEPSYEKPSDEGGLTAAALFSLKNIPWGWVAVLVILILFGTILYLLFSKPKI